MPAIQTRVVALLDHVTAGKTIIPYHDGTHIMAGEVKISAARFFDLYKVTVTQATKMNAEAFADAIALHDAETARLRLAKRGRRDMAKLDKRRFSAPGGKPQL